MKAIKSKTENIKEITDFVEEPLSLEANGLIEEIRIIQKNVGYRILKIIDSNKNTYDFSDYKTFKELFRDLYYRNMTKHEFDAVLGALSEYCPRDQIYIEAKNKLDNANNFYKGRKKSLKGLKIKYF